MVKVVEGERVELNESNVKEIGVLMPTLSYRFTFMLNADPGNWISRQITDLKLDYVNSELTINVIQPLSGFDMHEFLAQNINNDHIGVIRTLDGKEDNPGRDLVMNLRVKTHEFILDYASDEVAKHVIVFDIL